MKARDIMTHPVRPVREDCPLEDAARSRHVGEFMSRAVARVDVADELEVVITKMQKTGFHRLPMACRSESSPGTTCFG